MQLRYLTLSLYVLYCRVGYLAADMPLQQPIAKQIKTYEMIEELLGKLDTLHLQQAVHPPIVYAAEAKNQTEEVPTGEVTADQLPDDVWGQILGFCLFKEILAWAQVTKHAHHLIMDNPLKTLWEQMPVVINVKHLIFADANKTRLPIGVLDLRLVQKDVPFKVEEGWDSLYRPYGLWLPWLGKQKYLNSLSCEGVNCLMDLPKGLTQLNHLERLNICALPAVELTIVFQLKSLKELILSTDMIRKGYDYLPTPFRTCTLTTLVVQDIRFPYTYREKAELAERYEKLVELVWRFIPGLTQVHLQRFDKKAQAYITSFFKGLQWPRWVFSD